MPEIRSVVNTAGPDFAELDEFLGQHILLTLEEHFNSKIESWLFPYT